MRHTERDMVQKRQYVCSAEAAAGASRPATEIMCGPDTFSNPPDDKKGEGEKKKRLFVKAQTEHEEEWVCFSLVSVDRGCELLS